MSQDGTAKAYKERQPCVCVNLQTRQCAFELTRLLLELMFQVADAL